MQRIGILLFDDVEELDAVGPWEVFGAWAHAYPEEAEVVAFAANRGPVRAASSVPRRSAATSSTTRSHLSSFCATGVRYSARASQLRKVGVEADAEGTRQARKVRARLRPISAVAPWRDG